MEESGLQSRDSSNLDIVCQIKLRYSPASILVLSIKDLMNVILQVTISVGRNREGQRNFIVTKV